ncbi:hypothetical protein [Jeotgalibacillus proteolyticus]|uniref:Uncharacterized protein n=1 Tax=Jeotgalibacillus proteolyticus TaxID=2082395 RepID=A0A2S5G765_9BACL|nr:hypothetical protein [Jeotgalibacillus proteolyticus]PPA68728.1 hypothetical protein C4B60_19360 [Jeotgalibacillus proteolyticus]PPA68805.1 hypothetical protein C4B60_19790 [Jeotgalibacillus proteolyticus]
MTNSKKIKDDISKTDFKTGKTNFKVEFEGMSAIPFWNDDLKAKAAIALLKSIDIQNYVKHNMYEQAEEDYQELITLVNAAYGRDL